MVFENKRYLELHSCFIEYPPGSVFYERQTPSKEALEKLPRLLRQHHLISSREELVELTATLPKLWIKCADSKWIGTVGPIRVDGKCTHYAADKFSMGFVKAFSRESFFSWSNFIHKYISIKARGTSYTKVNFCKVFGECIYFIAKSIRRLILRSTI